LGLPAAASGTDAPVGVTVTGAPTGAAGSLTFVASGDGTIGLTEGLTITVQDQNGQVVATLDVGAGYEPGTPLALPDGIEVAFSAGDVQGSAHQRFVLEVPGDSDS